MFVQWNEMTNNTSIVQHGSQPPTSACPGYGGSLTPKPRPDSHPPFNYSVLQNRHSAIQDRARNTVPLGSNSSDSIQPFETSAKPPTSPRQSSAFHHAQAGKIHLHLPRLPYQHNNTKKMDTTHLNRAKETGSCPDSNRGPLATDSIEP